MKPKSFRSVLKELELNGDLPKPRPCKCCGLPLHPIKVNRYVGFWIHRGVDIQECAAKNVVNPGKPVIAQCMNVSQKVIELWNSGAVNAK